MASSWDWIISLVILLWLGLVIAAGVTKQTIPELLSGIRDFISGTRQDVVERGEELIYLNE